MEAGTTSDIAAAVRQRRRDLGLTQIELGKIAGVSSRWIYRVETGHETVELGRFLQVVRALDLMIRFEVAQEPSQLDGLVDG